MSKRSLSLGLVALPRPKRAHTEGDTSVTVPRRSLETFDTLFYDELILHIFSHLSYRDLCAVQRTNRNWARLALDNQLWKGLYLKEYGRGRLRGGRGFITGLKSQLGRNDGREFKPLPHGKAVAVHDPELSKDWKQMFRISTNWRTGRCRTSHLNFQSEDTPIPGPSSSRLHGLQRDVYTRTRTTHVVLAGTTTILASPAPSTSPELILISPYGQRTSLRVQPQRRNVLQHITAIAADQSPPSSSPPQIRLVVCLSSGEIIVQVLSTSQSLTTTHVYAPSTRTQRTIAVHHVAYHHPLLVTLSSSFHLSIYDLSGGKFQLRDTLSSFTSYPPSSMVLTMPFQNKLRGIYQWRVLLTYASPVFPEHWSVGVTEVLISNVASSEFPSLISPSTSTLGGINFSTSLLDSEGPSEESRAIRLCSSRSTRAFDIPFGFIDQAKYKLVREQWGRKILHVSGTQTDGKWVVLAPAAAPTHNPYGTASTSADSYADPLPSTSSSSSPSPPSSPSSHDFGIAGYTPASLPIQLYRLSFPSSSSSNSNPKLTFVRNLYGPSGPSKALALADGRCVSFGVDGSVWVWDLEAGTGVEVESLGRHSVGRRRDADGGDREFESDDDEGGDSEGEEAGDRMQSGVEKLHIQAGLERAAVTFDERRIVTAGERGVVVRHFDA